MIVENNLREVLVKQLSNLASDDMTNQSHVINKCVYEMIKNKEIITLESLVEKCNRLYLVQETARYGEIISNRVRRAVGGTSPTSSPMEINNIISSSGLFLKIGKNTGKVLFKHHDINIELDLNAK